MEREMQGRDEGAREMARDERLMSVIKVINWFGFNPCPSPSLMANKQRVMRARLINLSATLIPRLSRRWISYLRMYESVYQSVYKLRRNVARVRRGTRMMSCVLKTRVKPRVDNLLAPLFSPAYPFLAGRVVKLLA